MRLFVAVHFTPEIRRALLDAAGELRRQSASARMTRPENLHLTLAFIGETENRRAAQEAVLGLSAAPFSIAVGGCGRFGDLWWAGVAPSPALSSLAAEVGEALRQRGFVLDRRPFRPHITLARQVESAAPIRLSLPEMTMTVRRVSLMRSDRIAGRLTYTEVCGRVLG